MHRHHPDKERHQAVHSHDVALDGVDPGALGGGFDFFASLTGYGLLIEAGKLVLSAIVSQYESAQQAAGLAKALESNNAVLVQQLSNIIKQAFVQDRIDTANLTLKTLTQFMLEYSNNTADLVKLSDIDLESGHLIDIFEDPQSGIGLSGLASFIAAACLRIEALKLKAKVQPGDMVNAKNNAFDYSNYAIGQISAIYQGLSARFGSCDTPLELSPTAGDEGGGLQGGWGDSHQTGSISGYRLDGNYIETDFVPLELNPFVSWDPCLAQAAAECEAARYSNYRDNYAVPLLQNQVLAMWQTISRWRGFHGGWTPELGLVAFRTANGHYLTAEWGGGREINAAYTNLGDYSKFYMIQFDDVRRLFVTYSGNTIWADGGGGAGVSARNWGAGDWEAMAIVPAGSKVGLKLA